MKQQIYNTALYLRLSRDDELQGSRDTIKWISDLCVCYISQKQKQRINILVKNGIYPTFVIYKYYIEGYGKREK